MSGAPSIPSDRRARLQRVARAHTEMGEALLALEDDDLTANPNGNRAGSRGDGDDARQAWKDNSVIAWVTKRIGAGAKVDDLVRDSAAGKYGWPMPDRGLGQNAAEKCEAIAEDRVGRGETKRRRAPTESGKRLHALHAEKRAGRASHTDSLWHLEVDVMKAASVVECFDVPELEWDEENEMMIVQIFEDLGRLARWNDAAIDVVTARMGELGRQRKVGQLRARAEDPSSTPSERATAVRLAEKLERRRSEENAS